MFLRLFFIFDKKKIYILMRYSVFIFGIKKIISIGTIFMRRIIMNERMVYSYDYYLLSI